MLQKVFNNEELEIELKSFVDYKQNVFFLGKDVAKILGYKDSVNALKRHVSEENKMIRFIQNNKGGKTTPQQNNKGGKTTPQ